MISRNFMSLHNWLGRFFIATVAVASLLVAGVVSQIVVATASVEPQAKIDKGFTTPVICPARPDSTDAKLVAVGDRIDLRRSGGDQEVLVEGVSDPVEQSATYPVTVAGREQGALLVATGSGQWLASTPCRAADVDHWFVGGSGAVESQSLISLINDSASPSIVQISGWSAVGPLADFTLDLAGGETRVVPVDQLASGNAAVAFRVRALSGRIGAFMTDRRSRGLRSLGAEFVSVTTAPALSQVLVGVNAGSAAGRLRIVVPGEQDAIVRVDVVSGSSRFTPENLDEIEIGAGRVRDIPLDLTTSSGAVALIIESSTPVSAAVFSAPKAGPNAPSDFSWVVASQPIGTGAHAIIPRESKGSLLLFSPKVNATVVTSAGAKSEFALQAGSLTSREIASALRLQSEQQVFGAVVLRTPKGYSVFPLNPMERGSVRAEASQSLDVVLPR
jgi:hypothetical protein